MSSKETNLAGVRQKQKFSVAIQTEGYKNLISGVLQDPKRAMNFVANVSSVVANNPALQECDSATILSAALMGESLNLSLSPQLGHFYLVPFELKEKKDRDGNVISPARTVATPVIGYKGYSQLAARTGQYKYLNAIAIKKGELVRFDRIREEAEFDWIEDDFQRDMEETAGYYAYFEYMNGFRKAMYWTKEKVLTHAMRYVPAVKPKKAKGDFPGRVSLSDYFAGKAPVGTEWVYSSLWHTDFDSMACKTLFRQLVTKWGALSSEYVMATEADGRLINKDLTPDLTISTTNVPEYEVEAKIEPDTSEKETDAYEGTPFSDNPNDFDDEEEAEEVSLNDI